MPNILRVLQLPALTLAATALLVPMARAATPEPVVIDHVWSGTRVDFAAVADGTYVFIGYYDADRHMAVARLDTATGRLEKTVLSALYNGWDSHDSVTIAMDAAGAPHIAGNMHNTRLTVFRDTTPQAIDHMVADGMTGRDEDRVTYPTFIRGPAGALFFSYREGGSGDGAWIVNRWNGTHWQRAVDAPVFGSRYSGGSVNAYPSDFVLGPDGRFHVAIVWRATPDVATNFRLSYASTADFAHWTAADGHPITLPLTPDNATVVDDAGQDRGLLNNIRLTLDPSGRPVIAYSKYDPTGHNAVYVARLESTRWRVQPVVSGTEARAVKGIGTLSFVAMGPVAFANPHDPQLRVTVPGRPAEIAHLDPADLHLISTSKPAPSPIPPVPADPAPDLAEPQTSTLAVLDWNTPAAPPRGWLVWQTQRSHQDTPRACTPQEPKACNPPPSLLRYIPAPGG